VGAIVIRTRYDEDTESAEVATLSHSGPSVIENDTLNQAELNEIKMNNNQILEGSWTN
jgi:hypothetical protein